MESNRPDNQQSQQLQQETQPIPLQQPLLSPQQAQLQQEKEAIQRSNKLRVFWLANSWNTNTGYAKCAREILSRIGKEFEVFHVGQQSYGEMYKPEGFEFFVLPYKDNGAVMLQHQLDLFEPDILIIQDDLFPLVSEGIHNINFKKTKLCLYAAVDGEPLAWSANQILDKADKIVAMTNYGKRVLNEAGYEDLSVIYHGVDINMFKPMMMKDVAKEQLGNWLSTVWKKPITLKGKCLFYACGRNSTRKDFLSLFRAWGKFAKGKEDVMLLVNSINYNANDLSHFDMISKHIPYEGGESDLLWKKICFFPAQTYFRGAPEEQVGKMTATADAHVTTAFGEGFGMVMLESMACGVPVISNSYSTPPELIGNNERGLLAKSKDMLFLSWGIGHCPVDVDDFANKLEEFYQLWKSGKHDERFMEPCLKFAKSYTWDRVAEDWKTLIKDVCKNG